jgi:uncharacterized protein (TIRG00374 family)
MTKRALLARPSTIQLRAQPKQLIVGLVIVLMLYVVVPQLGAFKHSLSLLTNIQLPWLALGIASYLLTAPASSVLYKLLSPKKLSFGRTTVVHYGSSFANRLLPGGLGALSVGYLYLRRQRCMQPEAIAVVTLNNMLGFAGHAVLLTIVLLFMPLSLHGGKFTFTFNTELIAAFVIGAGLLLLAYVLVRHVWKRFVHVLSATWQQLQNYRNKKWRLGAALGVSMCLTLLYALCLWASSRALHIDVNLAQAVVILAVGVGLGAAVPLPGGLGGAEAGLVVGLLAFHVPADGAIAVAILYRLATYWLGFMVGAVAFFVCEKRAYF